MVTATMVYVAWQASLQFVMHITFQYTSSISAQMQKHRKSYELRCLMSNKHFLKSLIRRDFLCLHSLFVRLLEFVNLYACERRIHPH